MKFLANSAAVVSACTAAMSWVEQVEAGLRIAGTFVAVVAGALAIVVHIRTLRKKDKK